MQFIRNGPDIPERLLQLHEEGRVVFFCGAGISYPAGLPSFQKLADELYKRLHVHKNSVQEEAFKNSQYDTAIALLEADFVGGRQGVRQVLAEVLAPDLSAQNATSTHRAMLTLARSRSGQVRLITTNFDRLFEVVIHDEGLVVERFQAPLLPIPKNRWDGLVYLHGLLQESPTEAQLDRLVVASGDFGLAYLTERWAARFVSDLFRKYTTCFVGYSINDPVLRYMTDALAADKLRGEASPEMFAFGGYEHGYVDERKNEWLAKNVTPILYDQCNNHRLLHETLRAWADTYRDGLGGKERIVVEFASAEPVEGTQQDDFVGRVLWALSDPSGLPARRFAELDPVPSLEWLEPLTDKRYSRADLSRFNLPSSEASNADVAFSLVHRPTPYDRASWMAIADSGVGSSRWDAVQFQLGRWLSRHLDDPALVIWVAKNGGSVDEAFGQLIRSHLDQSYSSTSASRQERELSQTSPSSETLRPAMRVLWELVLAGRIGSSHQGGDIYRWRQHLKQTGLTTSLRFELRKIIAPRIRLRDSIARDGSREVKDPDERAANLVRCEVVLASDHASSAIRGFSGSADWELALPDLLADASDMLRDAMDLMNEVGAVSSKSDLSYIPQPSISEHAQNQQLRDWTVLISLTRDAWLAEAKRAPERAQLTAALWRDLPYPIFKRLALFAAAHHELVPTHEAIDWLLSDDAWWLWSVETQREAMRLLVSIAPHLDSSERTRLEEAILAGPPQGMFKEEVDPDRLSLAIRRGMWLRLAKLESATVALGQEAKDRLLSIQSQHSQWRLAVDHQDEFPFWMGSDEDWREFIKTPRRRQDLVEWLRQHPNVDPWKEDDWSQRCRESFSTVASALCALGSLGEWPEHRWREALQTWSTEEMAERSWRYLGPVLDTAPDCFIRATANEIASWLQVAAKITEQHETGFFSICRRILDMDHADGVYTDEPVMRAINHPIGRVTEALLHWWHKRQLVDGQGLPPELRSTFTALCDVKEQKYVHARVLLAANAITLFRVDEAWTTAHLLPLFRWDVAKPEARSVWAGFLLSARLYRPFMDAIKVSFLSTAEHYAELGDAGSRYASILTFAALDRGDTFTQKELATAFRKLPEAGLVAAARALIQAQHSAGEQRQESWVNRIAPFMESIWPRSADIASQNISEPLAILCIASGDAFPEAVNELSVWLQPTQHPEYVLHSLLDSDLCTKFPDAALKFLDCEISGVPAWYSDSARRCLDAMRDSSPAVADDPRFHRLSELLRQHGR